MKSQEMIQGVYVHTPFCLQKCLYCDFPSYAGCSADVRERYVRALCREIRQGRADGWYGALPVAPDATIYFGGGTPTVLTTDQLGRVVAALREAGWWNRPAEATMEANPGTVDASSLRALRELGFTRVSLGVQSLQDRELRAIGRIHTAAEAKEAVALAKAAGFERVSIDLMYGLPGQTLDSYGKTLEEAAALGLRHVSAYSLILEEGTPLERLVASGRVTLPDEDTVYAMYEATDRFWTARGLRRYEISNYAAPGQESRHNQVYWRYEPYAAFGAAACGFDGRRRRTNPAGVADYLAAVEAGLPAGAGPRTPGTPAVGAGNIPAGGAAAAAQGSPWWDEEDLDVATRLEEALFMGLRMVQGVSLEELGTRFGVDIRSLYKEEMANLIHRGMLYLDGDRMALTPYGMRYGNEAFEAFIRLRD